MGARVYDPLLRCCLHTSWWWAVTDLPALADEDAATRRTIRRLNLLSQGLNQILLGWICGVVTFGLHVRRNELVPI